MAKATRRYQCAERAAGCPEVAFYEFGTQREAREYDNRYAKTPWRCTRHSRPNEVLGEATPTRTTTAVAKRLIEGSPKQFWVEEGRTTGSGLAYGPGFRAWADDFPEETRLVVTATIEPPLEDA